MERAQLERPADHPPEVGRAEAADVDRLGGEDGRHHLALDLDVATQVGLGESIAGRREQQASDRVGSIDDDARSRSSGRRRLRADSASTMSSASGSAMARRTVAITARARLTRRSTTSAAAGTARPASVGSNQV